MLENKVLNQQWFQSVLQLLLIKQNKYHDALLIILNIYVSNLHNIVWEKVIEIVNQNNNL